MIHEESDWVSEISVTGSTRHRRQQSKAFAVADPLGTRSRWANIQSCSVLIIGAAFSWRIRHVQIEKLAAGVSHAADFGHALLEPGFVASKVVAHQLAVPGAEEVTRMLASPARPRIFSCRYSGKWSANFATCRR